MRDAIDAQDRVMSRKMKFDAVPDPFKLRKEGTAAAIIGGPLGAARAVSNMPLGGEGVVGLLVVGAVVSGIGFVGGSLSGVYKATVNAHKEKLGQNAYINTHGKPKYDADLAEQRQKNDLLKKLVATTTKTFEAKPDIQGILYDRKIPYEQRKQLRDNPEILIRNAIVRGDVDLIALERERGLAALSETLVKALSDNSNRIKNENLEKKLPKDHELVSCITQALQGAGYTISVASPSPIISGEGRSHTPPPARAIGRK